MMTHTSADYRS